MYKLKILSILLLFTMIAGCQQQATIVLAGSRSVTPIIETLSEEYKKDHTNIKIDIQGGGSSAGVTAADSGVANIGMVSRSLKVGDPALTESIIAYDGVAVIVHPSNPIKDITVEQLAAIYAGNVKNWKEIGGSDAPITIIDKEEGSGTRDVFLEKVMGEKNISSTAVVMNGTGAARAAVASDPNAIGYISFASVTNVTFVQIAPKAL